VARRFAEAGYHAVAPHLFHRTGAPALGYDDPSQVVPHVAALDDDKVLADVDAVLAHLAGVPWGSPQVAVVGFCLGGRVSFLVAARRPLGAAVGFYGGGIVTSRFPMLPPLVDEAGDLKTPWLGLFGDRDEMIAVADVERLRAELGPAKVDYEIVRYPDAGHGFHCDQRGSYVPEAAADAWARTLAWLGAHLAPPASAA
jgi:carboxymethylenebutenolidase